jgi:hypothetical protein
VLLRWKIQWEVCSEAQTLNHNEITIFWGVTTCSQVDRYQPVWGVDYPLLQVRKCDL